ncbi:DeoR/GlpR family DNA-binding transcription regulator [Lachnospiraceae bacterium ASD3451]|uniref:DeoR/GlpR family DNA-binding transcription regulator n=1 Tax=Diplocloster agilis TaxID=2850323 RepID=UPI001D781B0A|nr:DeoR/GlpR family DNA-binding transcription regulator [Diplocloster agilis]MBU9742239.1 DeoR/GlpR family DNA-binding transcription regulator [Diplocloster agilis]
MKTESRQIAIYNMVKSNREMSVNALAECFGVSPMTIRRDLDNLEHAKLIHRAYGKAFIANEDGSEMAFVLREASNLELKQKIAQTARRYLTGINSLYVDGSSTAHELIKILPTDRSYTIFTNSVATLLLLQQKEWITTFVIGGFLCDDNNTLDDSTSAEIAKRIFVDATFTSCSGFSAEGTFNNGITGSQVKRIMNQNSHKNYVLADHTKQNRYGIFLLDMWDKVDALITDQKPEPEMLKAIESNGVEVLW